MDRKDEFIIDLEESIDKIRKTDEYLAFMVANMAAIVENSDDAVIGLDNDGTILSWNNGAKKMYLYSSEEIIGKNIFKLILQDNIDELHDILKKINEGKFIHNFETVRQKKNEEKIDVSVTISPIKDSEGAIIGASTIEKDITQQKIAERKLKEARDHLEELVEERTSEIGEAYKSLRENELKIKEQANLLDISYDAIFVRDMDDKITFWNNGAEKTYGWRKKEALGKITHTLLQTKFPEHLNNVKETVLKEGKWEGELNHTKRNGEHIIVLSRWALQKDEIGNPQGFLEINTDITERKETEEKLKTYVTELEQSTEEVRSSQIELNILNHKYQDLFDTAPVGYVILNSKGIITEVNETMVELTGFPKSRLNMNAFILLMSYKSKDEFYRALNSVNDGPRQTAELELIKLDGTTFYALVEFVFNPNDEQLRLTISDITKRKKGEEQLKEVIEELKRSNHELESFAYITSHDLQEPLRTIANYAQLVERRYKGELDNDADKFLEFMVNGATRMKEMIQGLLDYSRVGTHGEKFKEFNAEEALNIALSNLQSAIKENNAEITHDKLPLIYADENQIISVFQNLISNALKFCCMEYVEPKVHVSTKETDEEYIFSVSDNGIGLEEEYSNKIFEVFKRLHTMDEYHGVGIGLAIVKRIIDRHNGRVWVESKLGKGSIFYFTLPKP